LCWCKPEPTSGLDSTTSYDLVFALGALARKGVNVITVLHQPSFPLYQMFTNVLLLGKGGRTVFLGKSEDALPYFQNCGYSMPPFINPADFFMDVIGGQSGGTGVVRGKRRREMNAFKHASMELLVHIIFFSPLNP
jgi:ABC-type multidrug transport system ATPase subunit